MDKTLTKMPGSDTRDVTMDQLPNYKDVLTVEEVQECLRVSRATAYELIKTKEIGHIRIGNTIRVRKIQLVEYIERITVMAKAS